MAQRQSIQIGNRTFNTKAECKDFFKKILNSCELNHPISPTDFYYLTDLLKRHPEYEKKAGSGIKEIIIQRDQHWGGKTRAFHIIRTDGSTTDFSYLHCIDNDISREPIKMFKQSARTSVEDQIWNFMMDFKNKNLDEEGCFFCTESQTNVLWEEAHVDHAPPLTFIVIVENFITMKNIEPEEIEYTGFGDNEYHKQFKDENLRREFSDYHRAVAKLRVISRQANLRMKKRN